MATDSNYLEDSRKEDLEQAKERLTAYLDKEKEILKGGVQAYGIGNRNLTKYQADLANIRAAIKDLKNEIAELQALLGASKPRRAVRIIPQDW